MQISSTTEQLCTINDFVRFATSQFEQAVLFYGHGTDNAWDEALYLVLGTLNLTPQHYANVANCRLLSDERETILSHINIRITERMPVAYILEQARFAGLTFYVDKRVLIPRSPIAELIGHQFSSLLDYDSVKTIADVGTGSGCIACALSYAFPLSHVDAFDISKQALEVAKKNCQLHDLTDRITLYHSDLLDAAKTASYDLIVANPPYVALEVVRDLPPEYQHEPVLGLAAGEDGLTYVLTLLANAGKHLNPAGILVVEVGESAPALIARFTDIPFLWLDFEYGGDGVFSLTAEQLLTYQSTFAAAL